MAFPKSSDGRFEYGAFLEVVSPERMTTKGLVDVDCAFEQQSCSFGGVYAVLDEVDMENVMIRYWRFDLEDHYGYWEGYCLRCRSRYWRALTLLYLALLLAPL